VNEFVKICGPEAREQFGACRRFTLCRNIIVVRAALQACLTTVGGAARLRNRRKE